MPGLDLSAFFGLILIPGFDLSGAFVLGFILIPGFGLSLLLLMRLNIRD